MRAPDKIPWAAVIGVAIVIGVISVASCQSLRWLRPPYHEPAVARPSPG